MDQDATFYNICTSSNLETNAFEQEQSEFEVLPPLCDSLSGLDDSLLGNTCQLTPPVQETYDSEPLQDMGIENSWSEDANFPVTPISGSVIPLPPPGGFDDISLDTESHNSDANKFPESDLGLLFSSDSPTDEDVKDATAVPGVCGLRNLGNTCFMAAGLQCLAASTSLVKFFLTRTSSEKDISTLSLTDQFQSLLRKMWSGNFSVIRPHEFKQALGYNHPQFKDFRQHDCQEFLALLLDNLHEQLNTASSKSIVSDVSTAPATPHSHCDATDLWKPPSSDGCDCEQTAHSSSLVDGFKCSQSASSHSSDSSGESRNLFRLQPIPENISSFKDEDTVEDKDSGMDSFQSTSNFSESEKDDIVMPSPQSSDSGVIHNIISQHLLKNHCKKPIFEQPMEKNVVAHHLNNVTHCFRNIGDIMKDAKTSNVNVLVTEQEANNEIRFDSEKFPKHESSRRRYALENHNLTEFHNFYNKSISVKRIKEINCLQESLESAEVVDSLSFDSTRCFNNIKRMRHDDNEKNFRVECERKLRHVEIGDVPLSGESTEAEGPSNENVSLNEEIEADKHWEKHTSLNQSIIADSFQGQFKSTVVCSACKHLSVTYEPFMYLSVPLPHAMERQICVTFVPSSTEGAVKYLVTVNKHDKVTRLKEELLKVIGESCMKTIALAEVLDHHIARILDENSFVRYINDTNRSIYAFELISQTSSQDCEMAEGDFVEQKCDTQPAMELMGPHCLNGGGDVETIPDFDDMVSSESTPGEKGDGWRKCAICLEDKDSNMKGHTGCSCVLCEDCIERSFKHYGGDDFTCPVCNVVAKIETEFVPISKYGDVKPTIRILSVPVVFRVDTDGDGNNNKKQMSLFGHPNLIKLPNRLPGQVLYQLIDRLNPYKQKYSLVFVDGQGYRCSRCMYTVHCHGCKVISDGEVILQTGDTLAVRFTEPIFENNTQEHTSMKKQRSSNPLSLYDCLHAFSESEQLDEHNPWYCPICQKNQCATKTLSVWRYPDFLIVYLKRFVFHDCVSIKLENKVTFPLSGLSVSSPSILQHGIPLPYNLYACVCHFGGSSAGHYTAYAKHPQSNEWHYYNDDIVTKQKPQDDDFSSAYILFYQKQGVSYDLSLPKLLMESNPKNSIEQIILNLDSSAEQDCV